MRTTRNYGELVKHIDESWEFISTKLSNFVETTTGLEFLENEYIKKTIRTPILANTKMCKDQINLLEDAFENYYKDEPIDILEIGAGYGNFCKLLHESKLFNISSYTILDNKGMLACSKRYLDFNKISAQFISAENYFDAINKKYDLVISIQCLSETPKEYRETILTKLVDQKVDLFLIDGDKNNPEVFAFYKNLIDTNYENNIVTSKNINEICYGDSGDRGIYLIVGKKFHG